MKMMAIGIDLGGTNIRGALVNKEGELVEQYSEFTPAKEGRSAVIKKICLVIDYLMNKNKNILGIGIGTPGIIDQNTGNIIGASPNIVDWVGTPLRKILEERYRLRIELNNDVNAITMGEFCFGGGNLISQDLACIALGTGVGIGIILNGAIFKNAHELGHMVIDFDGPRCGCSRQGCVEVYTSGTWILKNYRKLIEESGLSHEGDSAKIVFDKYQAGDIHARGIISNFINALSSLMANIILSFSVTNFIITGGVSQSLPLFKEQLLEEARKRSISHLNNQITIRKGTLGERAGILGAVSLVFKIDNMGHVSQI